MDFYTNVHRMGSFILLRGFEDGKRVKKRVKFQPTLYVPSRKTDTQWAALDGTPVEPMKFDNMREAAEFVKKYEHIDSYNVYGNTRYVPAFLQERYPGEIRFDGSAVNVCNIDIEVSSSNGFPKPEEAVDTIVSIALHNNIENKYFVWGIKPYDETKKREGASDDLPVEYRQFRDEVSMLNAFLEWWNDPYNTPDIITGWYIRLFDVPYLCNRLHRLFGEDGPKKLSPWNTVERRGVTIKGQELQTYNLVGISQLDYLDIFQKFTANTLGAQESYKLDHIAYVVLGERKLSYEEHGKLQNLYEADHQKFIDYNIRDVELVRRIDDKLGLIGLVMTMAYMSGVNYTDTLGTTAMWDSLIFRDLADKRVAIPQGSGAMKSDYPGGFVKDPHVGSHEWVCSFDLNSLYPNLIIQYNMSPETIVSDRRSFNVTPDHILSQGVRADVESEGDIVAANGVHFKSDQVGVLPRIIREIYDERVAIKKLMLVEKQRKEGIDKSNTIELRECERAIAHHETKQTALKIALNSLYGALGNQYFRYFDTRIAEGVTLSGQLTIRWAEKKLNQYLNNLLKTDDVDYVIAIDTDSVYLNLKPIVDKFNPKDPVKFLDQVCHTALEKHLEESFAELSDIMHCQDNRMVMKREAIASRGIWTAKKRYILNVHNNEGVQYAKPKLKVMGIEAVRSSTPEVCREALKDMFTTIMTKTESEAQDAIEVFRKKFMLLPPEDIAFPRSVNNLAKFMTPAPPFYKKGVPIGVRAAILYNQRLKAMALENTYEAAKEGEKIKFTYLKQPNPLRENVIGWPTHLPPEFELHRYVDYDTQFTKTFLDPLESIFAAIGWSTVESSDLSAFF